MYASFCGAATIAFLLYVFAGVTDWLDGYIARRCNMISDLGKLLDALNDKIFTVGIFILLIGNNMVPTWVVFCVLIIVCREFLITGLRIIAAKEGNVLAAESLGKIKTVFQIIAMGAFLLIKMLSVDFENWVPSWFTDFLYVVNLVILAFATIITAYSGFGYVSKYRHLLRL